MHRVLVTGAGGFIGQALVRRLLAQGVQGRRVDEVVAADLSTRGLPADARLRPVQGSITEAQVLDAALAEPVQTVFHLASLPGGAAENDPILGRRLNLEATMLLLDALRVRHAAPRLVFASTIGVYGETLPAWVDEDTQAVPSTSYGAYKLASEILVADAARRGWVQGCSLRLPGVVARPGDGAGLASAFMSRLFWQLRAGQPVVLPVGAQGRAWWMSVHACVDNLLHAATFDTERLGPRRVVQLPALHLSMAELVDALVGLYGPDRRSLVRYESEERIVRLFGSYPALQTPLARGFGFVDDGTVIRLCERAVA